MVGFFDLEQSEAISLIHGTKQDIMDAMTKSPQRIRSLRLNQADTIRPASADNFEWDHLCEVIKNEAAFQAEVSQCLADKYTDAEDVDLAVEEKIFNGFYSYNDKDILQKFQSSSWQERLVLLDGVEDARIQQLGRRLIAFNAGHLLGEKYADTFSKFLVEKWEACDPDVKWTTIASVQMQLAELEEDGFDKGLLNEMKTFYHDRAKAQGC